ncbi:type-1 angiotensin II receptor-associated protein-like isoform X1 [Ostrea edulis]|uniref:type-1 angiotensin II receptor-associated protein-like isoform X1 n=2 Tax=Ostrea edulis TaxID=37623 RepID=UPI0020961162|nr:type-1 angiotensin II receptor-associated protein-like isoform X1 [Ostrea edulis]
MNPPHYALKVIVCVHFILMIWGAQCAQLMPGVYWLSNTFVLLLGVWGIACPDSYDAILMYLILHVFTILEDIILLGIYHPRSSIIIENSRRYAGIRNEYRFSLGMTITNLILKPFTAFLMWRIYQDRGGRFSDFNFPNMPQFGGPPPGQGNYENIDQPVPSNNVETASSDLEKPHQ